MIERYRPPPVEKAGGNKAASGGDYFPDRDRKITFIGSGCTLLDCVLGGGWPLGRVVNIVGDKSTGKTLLAIEACANFARQFPKGKIFYRECEAAFDEPYAAEIGLPVKRVDFGPKGLDTLWETIEDVFDDLEKRLNKMVEDKTPGLYIIDSLDALGSVAELDLKTGEGSYALGKQKLLSQRFGRVARLLKDANCLLIIISQIRDKIGKVFGSPHTRSGGRALDFYSTHILWLTHIKQIKRTISSVERVVGMMVQARSEKNKVSAPQRRAEFIMSFYYGIDDLEACLSYLDEVKRPYSYEGTTVNEKNLSATLKKINALPDESYKPLLAEVQGLARQTWAEVELGFRPTRRKYE